jgi:hypothetical protein
VCRTHGATPPCRARAVHAAPGRLRYRRPSYAFCPGWQQPSHGTGHDELVELQAIDEGPAPLAVRRQLRLAWPAALPPRHATGCPARATFSTCSISVDPRCRGRPHADAPVGENARVSTYTVNEDAVSQAKRRIDARQYVLRSRWQDVQPRAREQNAFLKTHSWEEYAAWHLGLTEGAPCLRLRRLPPSAPDGTDRLPLPCGGVAAQGDRAGRTRVLAVPRPEDGLTTRRLGAPGLSASNWIPPLTPGGRLSGVSFAERGHSRGEQFDQLLCAFGALVELAPE